MAINIDTKHIKLELAIDWEQKKAIGKNTITFELLEDSDFIQLDAGYLTIHEISLNNQVLEYNYDGKDSAKNLTIFFNRTYSKSKEITLIISYNTNYENESDPNSISGSFGKGLRFFQPSSTTPLKRKQLWSQGEPNGNKYWFPCNEEISDIHTTELMVTVEKSLTVVSIGELISMNDNNEKTHTFHFKSDKSFPNYLVFIVIGEYSIVKQFCDSTPILTYGYHDEYDAIHSTVELLPDMMNYIEKVLNFPYPFKTYRQVVVQDYPFPGLIGQHSASIISDNYIDDFSVHNDFKYLWDGVAVQALANQWFGNLLIPSSLEDIWISYSFAQYFSGSYTSHCFGSEEYLLYYYPFEKGAVDEDLKSAKPFPIVPHSIDITNFPSATNSNKYKGSIVLRMLQNELGDEVFKKVLQSFVHTYAYKQVNTKDFQNIVEKVSGKSFDWFFQQWFYGTSIPNLEVSTEFDESKMLYSVGIHQIIDTVSSSNVKNIDYFQGTILVEIEDELKVLQLLPQEKNLYSFRLQNKPKYLNFNVKKTFLCDVVMNQSTEELLNLMLYSADISAKKETLSKLVFIANDSNTSIVLKEEIVTILKNEVLSNQYWRYRWFVLNSLTQILDVKKEHSLELLLKELIQTEKSWMKMAAINILGNKEDSSLFDLFVSSLDDESDRVVNAAAIAIGKTKHHHALQKLLTLENKKSWKNQNRISALNGMQFLNDINALEYVLSCLNDNKSARWYLAMATWDYPFAAVNTLVSLNQTEKGYPILFNRLKESLQDNDINDIFQNLQLINMLKLEKAKEVYILLKEYYKNDQNLLEVIRSYETQFLQNL